jgi:hypothetical protein
VRVEDLPGDARSQETIEHRHRIALSISHAASVAARTDKSRPATDS